MVAWGWLPPQHESVSVSHQVIPLFEEPTAVQATVLFTDIVGSTRHAVELGDVEWRRLLERHDRMVRAEVAALGGRVIKNLGDGYLAGFDAPARAAEAARALVAAARLVGLEIRAGLHTGEAQVLGDDLVGLTLHIAARVCSLAGPGRILATSDTVLGLDDEDVDAVDLGCERLRDIPRPLRLFELCDGRCADVHSMPMRA
jgi:class 3 adenylate cyclase